ncbi:MAG: hypothetical protein M0Z76_08620 [Gammaproteobacteria bacterium]|nr:hypothetical protein [Gammaproteobacteria bacterium]
MIRHRALLLSLALLLAGCTGKPPAPSPEPPRPVVDRAVLTLSAAAHTPSGNIMVPTDAIIDYAGLPGVFVLSAHDRARFRLIKVGKARNGKSEILSGLRGDETLVLPPFDGVFDGSPIHITRTEGTP